MASVHALAMDRPSPCPGLLAMQVSSPRWNGWIRSYASAAFSGGLVVLSMVMMVWFSPAWTVQVMHGAAEHLLRDAGSGHGLDPAVPAPAPGSGERLGRSARCRAACHRAERTRRPQPVDQQGLLPVRQAPQAGARAANSSAARFRRMPPGNGHMISFRPVSKKTSAPCYPGGLVWRKRKGENAVDGSVAGGSGADV